MSSFSFGAIYCPLRGLLYRNKDKRAMTARFRNVAKGNISRLRDAQAFHAAVKRPPYFMFARQRIHFTVSAACRACPSARCAVFFGACFCTVIRISAPRQRASVTLPRATFHACAMRKHFTRRSNDRRISRLRDSAYISP